MLCELIDLDTNQKISASSNTNIIGYSTMSQHHQEHLSLGIKKPSPSQSPSATLANDFAALGIPNQPKTIGKPVILKQQQQQKQNISTAKEDFPAQLVILEQPTEKFRFRYKSEMHGTHGSLNGANSKKTPKTYPEVELRNFNGNGVIRCSLYQTNPESASPHSHQLVVRKDDEDVCDPHDLYVSPDKGYVAQFQNMGIIHTAKKFIIPELFKKKLEQYMFLEGCDKISMRKEQEIRKETEKEAKAMNLNQVRLRFDAFKIEDDNHWTPIAEPVYSHPINNRKSAQTGELRICRLSSIVGSVTGGEDLILLVEKVSKKNIQVRFFEVNDDEETTWEAMGKFRESDVHHQYAIVVQTPAYKDRDIDRHVTVYIELIRPNDDERSLPVEFRYKPREAMLSRKRRRTCSTATTCTSSSISSSELPESVVKSNFNPNAMFGHHQQQQRQQQQQMDHQPTISEEYNKEKHLNTLYCGDSNEFMKMVESKSTELQEICSYSLELAFFDTNFSADDLLNSNLTPSVGRLEVDGASSQSDTADDTANRQKMMQMILSQTATNNPILKEIFTIFDKTYKVKNAKLYADSAKRIRELFNKYSNSNETGDSILHDAILNGNFKIVLKTYKIIEYFKLCDIMSLSVNSAGENPLHCACLYNKGEYIRPLLSLGCNPNHQDNNGDTPLHIAIRENYKSCIDYYMKVLPLKLGRIELKVNLLNDNGLTPLHMAIRKNNLEVAICLLQYDSSAAQIVNTKDGNNALHSAVLQQNPELVDAVLKYGAVNVETLNRSGQTAIDLTKCIDFNVRKQILDMLLAVKTFDDVSVKDEPFENDSESTTNTEDDDGRLSVCSLEFDMTAKDNANDSSCLSNKMLLARLAKLLANDDKWKKLANHLDMGHLLCLWTSAETMLCYVCNKRIPFSMLYEALAKTDTEAAAMLKSKA